ncbi:MAG TPA: hemerythrin domain-containing protein [Armatimonadota bacterium]|nr:hemerythrin domain-containing protein [Armatimonadota bacterium]
MDSHLKTGIKEIIEAYPAVGTILERYDIGCVPCTVGTCKLEDVVTIHTLEPDDEAALMAEIAQAIEAGPDAEPIAAPERPKPAAPKVITYSPPVQKLVGEHVLIKRLLALVPKLVEDTWIAGAMDAELMRDVLGFIRGYADSFHHMKEQDVLFDYTDKEAEIIRVIYEDHDRARGFVAAAAEAIESDDIAALCKNLTSYRELLTEHIDKEDQVLYPYIDRDLTLDQIAEIARRFQQADDAADADVPEKYERFIALLESRFESQ